MKDVIFLMGFFFDVVISTIMVSHVFYIIQVVSYSVCLIMIVNVRVIRLFLQ
jgi:hypothetical protein